MDRDDGGDALWLDVLHHLEDVVGPAAAASLVRYAATETAREAVRGGAGSERASAWLTRSLGGAIEVTEEGRNRLVLQVRGVEFPNGTGSISEALVLGVAKGLYLGRYQGGAVRVDAERAEGTLTVTVQPEAGG